MPYKSDIQRNKKALERYHKKYDGDPQFREKLLNRSREKYQKDPEHREYHITYSKKYNKNYMKVKKNYLRNKKSVKKWNEKNQEYIKQYRYTHNIKLKTIVVNHYGGKCYCCGETAISFLTIDHKNNDGNKHRRNNSLNGSRQTYSWIINSGFPPIFQIACYNCNCARAKEKDKICPHKKEGLKVRKV